MAHANVSIAGIRPLAEPYLRGYRAVAERGSRLCGYWFLRPGLSFPRERKRKQAAARRSETALGFFIGYLLRDNDHAFLNPQPPECLVFAFVQPVGGSTHRRLVSAPESLLRKTFDYIRWLTHCPPRFAFYERELAALVRHLSMRDWPRAKHHHFSRNFFIETLAWLVRSGLVRKLLAEELRAAG